MMEVFFTLTAASIACSILGPFLVLRRLSMVADALSHSVLLGIVIAFLYVMSLDSIWLKITAAVFGFVTVLVVEIISHKVHVKKADALAIVFPMFFSLAVILITRFCRNAHLDVEVVLMGNPLFAPFIRTFGVPKAMFQMLVVFLINLLFIAVHYQSLKISGFDPEFAEMQGIPVRRLYFQFMALVSLTCVLAFDSVGGILVISFFVAPAATACLFTKDLKITLLITLVLGLLNAWIGYVLGILWNVSLSGMCAVSGMIMVFISVWIHKYGIIHQWLHRYLSKMKVSEELILVHLFQHEQDTSELGYTTMHKYLNGSPSVSKRYIGKLTEKGLIRTDDTHQVYALTEKGRKYVQSLLDLRA